jgi:hypothetical protein
MSSSDLWFVFEMNGVDPNLIHEKHCKAIASGWPFSGHTNARRSLIPASGDWPNDKASGRRFPANATSSRNFGAIPMAGITLPSRPWPMVQINPWRAAR